MGVGAGYGIPFAKGWSCGIYGIVHSETECEAITQGFLFRTVTIAKNSSYILRVNLFDLDR